MHSTLWKATWRLLASSAALAIVVGCGGGALVEPEPLRAAAAREVSPKLPASAVEVSPTALFEWAQRAYPQYFYGPSSDGSQTPYVYRHYQWPGTYLGVANGDVFLLGALTGHQILRVGPLSAFKCHLLPINSCVPEWRSAVLARVNNARQAGGFPLASSSEALGAAAQAHAAYSIRHYYPNAIENPILATVQPNGWLTGHVEFVGDLGFTGELPVNRATAVGYSTSNAVGEVVGPIFSTLTYSEPDIPSCVDAQLNTVFHRAALLESELEHVGVGISDFAADANNYRLRVCVINTSVRRNASSVPREWTGIYPGAGQTGLPTRMGPERPDAAPAVSVKGYPVSLQVRSGMTLTASSFSLTTATGATVPTILLTQRETSWLRPNEAYLVPIGALSANTSYVARFRGTASDAAGVVPVDRSWAFTTGS